MIPIVADCDAAMSVTRREIGMCAGSGRPMKRLITATAMLALLTTAAYAASKPVQFYKGGYWETFGFAKNRDGAPMCGMQTSGDNNSLFVKWTPTDGMAIQVWKSNWRLTVDAKVSFGLEFIDNEDEANNATLNTENGRISPSENGIGTSLFLNIKDDDMADVLKAFSVADRMMINFPEGDEPSWDLKMGGSRKAANEFKHCMYIVQQSIKAAQPTSPVKPTSPIKPTSPVKQEPGKADDGSI